MVPQIAFRIPFEHVQTQDNLQEFISYILNEIAVEQVRAFMPKKFDTQLVFDPKAILKVSSIQVGHVSFENIRMDGKTIIDAFMKHVVQVKGNPEMGEHDKFNIFSEVHALIMDNYGYYNSMNPFRYMTFSWKIIFDGAERDYVVTKLSLSDPQWNYIDNSMVIRRQLLYEFMYYIEAEMNVLRRRLSKSTKYNWRGENRLYEVHELLQALLVANRVNFEKGDERTFVNEFLALFGESDKDYTYYRDKILSRKKRGLFLKDLITALEAHRKPTGKHSSE